MQNMNEFSHLGKKWMEKKVKKIFQWKVAKKTEREKQNLALTSLLQSYTLNILANFYPKFTGIYQRDGEEEEVEEEGSEQGTVSGLSKI